MPEGITEPSFSMPDWAAMRWFSSIFQWIQRRTKVVDATAAYTVAADVFGVRGDATSAAFAVTLPLALGCRGRQVFVKKIDSSANAVTPTASGSDTIDGSSTKALSSQYDKTLLVSDGVSSWDVIS